MTSFVVALLSWRHLQSTLSPAERFDRAWSNDDPRVAEQIAWRMVRQDTTRLPWWIRFTDAHTDVFDDDEKSSVCEAAIQVAVRERFLHALIPKKVRRSMPARDTPFIVPKID